MWLAIIVFIIVLGIIGYEEIKEPTHITCMCGSEITTKSSDAAISFQNYHLVCGERSPSTTGDNLTPS